MRCMMNTSCPISTYLPTMVLTFRFSPGEVVLLVGGDKAQGLGFWRLIQVLFVSRSSDQLLDRPDIE